MSPSTEAVILLEAFALFVNNIWSVEVSPGYRSLLIVVVVNFTPAISTCPAGMSLTIDFISSMSSSEMVAFPPPPPPPPAAPPVPPGGITIDSSLAKKPPNF